MTRMRTPGRLLVVPPIKILVTHLAFRDVMMKDFNDTIFLISIFTKKELVAALHFYKINASGWKLTLDRE
jgi:hypothetical protein